MPAPKPPVPLNGHCSVIFNNVLYTYSSEAFQSLPLREGGSWTKLPMGVSVTGGACVKVIPQGDEGQAALWVVGGSTSDTTYPGLQKFSFKDKAWQTIIPEVRVTQNRRNHAAAYLNQTQHLLLFAGSQDTADYQLSDQTFTISIKPPYSVQSFTSNAPPVFAPLLMPWDQAHAVMVGGDPQSRNIYTFGVGEGWLRLGTSLPEGIQDQTRTQCTVVAGDDGSRVLETYNMGVSPNSVSRLALLNPDGSPAAVGRTVGRKRKRDLTMASWPTYNNTLAPGTIRTSYSIAQDPSGLAIISGGNAEDPIAAFNQRSNTWENATALFFGQQILVSGGSSTASAPTATSTPGSLSTTIATNSATATPTSSATANAYAAGQKNRMLTVLGSTLGAIFGLAALAIIVLLLLRWRRERQKSAGKSPYFSEKDDRLSFADRGMASVHTEPAPAFKYSQSHHGSQSSLAIMTGRTGGHRRGGGNGNGLGSDASTKELVPKSKGLFGYESVEMSNIAGRGPLARVKDKIGGRMTTRSERTNSNATSYLSPEYRPSTDPMQGDRPVSKWPQFPPGGAAAASGSTSRGFGTTSDATAVPVPARPRSSGWSRYFNNNDTATNLFAIASGRTTYGSKRSSGPSESDYTDSRAMSGSHAIQPLDISATRFDGQRLSRVNTGSPTLSQTKEALGRQHGMTAEVRRGSMSSVSSAETQDEHTGRQATISWTPVDGVGARVDNRGESQYSTGNRSSLYSDTTGRATMQPPPRNLVGDTNQPMPTLAAPSNQPGNASTTRFPYDSYYFGDDSSHSMEQERKGSDSSNSQVQANNTNNLSWLNLGRAV